VSPIATKSGYFSSVGNHRFSITVDQGVSESHGVVRAVLPWRRRDFPQPELTDLIVVDARSHLQVPRCTRAAVSRDNVTVTFFASNGPGEYVCVLSSVQHLRVQRWRLPLRNS
jgi:hypothetical protein